MAEKEKEKDNDKKDKKDDDKKDDKKDEEEEIGCCAACWYGYCACVVATVKVILIFSNFLMKNKI